MKIFNVLAVSLALITSLPTLAEANQQGFSGVGNSIVASSKSLFVATTGEVSITFLSADSAFNTSLLLSGNDNVIFNNKTSTPFQTFTGFFEAGTELVFKINVNTTSDVFANGAAIRNADNVIHAGYQPLSGLAVIVGFEDMFGGGDRDYNDFVFLLGNVTVGPLSPVPEPSTYALMVAGLALVGANSKRRNK